MTDRPPRRSRLVLAAFSAALVVASGCAPADEPKGPVREPVDLFWYARASSDDFIRIPGFRTMADCRQAGAAMSRLITEERQSACEIAAGLAGVGVPSERGIGCDEITELRKPWFECGIRCRPWETNPAIARCKDTVEHR